MLSLEYLAGLVDGEGNIALRPSNKGKYRKYYPGIQITNTYRPVLEMVLLQFGGRIDGPKRSRGSTKDCWDWRATGDTARNLIRALIPHLIIKRDIAVQVLLDDQKDGV